MDRVKLTEEGISRLGEGFLSDPILDMARGRYVFADGHELPLIAGGDGNAYPLGPPTLAGNMLTVDLALKQPTRITKMVMDLTKDKFIIDRVFSSDGGVTGGAVIYDQVTQNDLYPERDVKSIAPGDDYPLVTSEAAAPKTASVEKWGGKTFITDEAKERNDAAKFANEVRKLANAIVRKVNAYAVSVLEAAIAEHNRSVIGNNWATFVLEGNAPTPPQDRPTADFAMSALDAEQNELGVNYNIWIVNPQEYANLVIGYGDKLKAVLEANGIKEMYSSNRVTPGKALAVAEHQAGGMRIEQPLASATWREEGKDKTWMKSSVRPVAYVTNPFSVLEFTGLAG